METDAIKEMIETGMPGSTATVTGDGYHFDAIVVSEQFDGLSKVKQQQLVYATLGDSITSGELHALTIKAFTPDQWQASQTQPRA